MSDISLDSSFALTADGSSSNDFPAKPGKSRNPKTQSPGDEGPAAFGPRNVDTGGPSPLTVQVIWLLVFLGICFGAAALGGLFTSAGLDTWYDQLKLPSFSPPDWLFGPVWTALYAMMAVAAWLVWREAGWRGGRGPLTLFFAQLTLNVAWSAIFFGLQRPGWATIELALLWLAILATTVAFHRFSRWAAGLMLPYLAWVGFAGVLNVSIWWLNRS